MSVCVRVCVAKDKVSDDDDDSSVGHTNALWTWTTRAKFALIHFSYKTAASKGRGMGSDRS